MPGLYGIVENTTQEMSQLTRSELHMTRKVTLAANAGALKRGQVLGQLTADYTFKTLTPGAADGTQTARAILLEDVTVGASAVQARVYMAGEYILADLVWPGGITDAQKNAAIQQLCDCGIIPE